MKEVVPDKLIRTQSISSLRKKRLRIIFRIAMRVIPLLRFISYLGVNLKEIRDYIVGWMSAS